MTSWVDQIFGNSHPNASARCEGLPRIAILTQEIDNLSCRQLSFALQEQGYAVDFVQYPNHLAKNKSHNAEFTRAGRDIYMSHEGGVKKLSSYDGVILRAWGAEHAGHEALSLFEQAGVTALNSADVSRAADSKVTTHEAFAEAGVPHPQTFAVKQASTRPEDVDSFLQTLGAPPYVIKGDVGTQGQEVYFCHSRDEVYQTLSTLGQDAVIQEYINTDSAKQQSYRVFVADGEVSGVVRMTAANNGVAATNTGGAELQRVDVFPIEFCDMAVRASNALGLNVSGVDMLLSQDGRAVVLEANDGPGISPMVQCGVPAHHATAQAMHSRLQEREMTVQQPIAQSASMAHASHAQRASLPSHNPHYSHTLR